MEIFVRYDVKDERGETRRERNLKHDTITPEINISDDVLHVWEWYADLSKYFVRVRERTCHPIPPSEFIAWRDMTGNQVHEYEFDLLVSLDRTYCRMMNLELHDYTVREKERQQMEIEKNKGRRRR